MTSIAYEPAVSASVVYETSNDVPVQIRAQVIELLNQRLADAVDLSMQAKQAHWNVKGPNFIALHELFDKIHAAVDEYADVIAERVVQLGGIAGGTVRIAAQTSELTDYPRTISDGNAHVNALAGALAEFGGRIRHSGDEADDLGDQDAVDICTEISRGIDKWLWFVEAHVQVPLDSEHRHP